MRARLECTHDESSGLFEKCSRWFRDEISFGVVNRIALASGLGKSYLWYSAGIRQSPYLPSLIDRRVRLNELSPGKTGVPQLLFRESNRQRVPLALAPTRGIRQSSAASDRRELITASSVKTSLAFEVREPAFDTPTRPFPFASRHANFTNEPR